MVCPHCKADISKYNTTCPVCGFSTRRKWFQKNSLITVMLMIVSLVFLGACAYFFLFTPHKDNGPITKLNQTYEGSILKVTATDIQVGKDRLSDDLTAAVYFVVENVSDQSTFLSKAHFKACVDNRAVNGSLISGFNQNGESLGVDMAPGKLAKGYYNVPISEGAKTVEIRIGEGYTDAEAVFVLDIPWDTDTATSTTTMASTTQAATTTTTEAEETASTQKPTTTANAMTSTQGTTSTAKTTASTQTATTTASTKKPTTTTASTTVATTPSQPANNTVSYAKFAAIQIGMSYQEVCELVGVEGTQSMKNGDTVFYTWKGAEQFSNISLAFQKDRLISKAQTGLINPSASTGTITLAEYDQIENGMTYEQVCQIIGGEGSLSNETGDETNSYHTVFYLWRGEASIASASLAFSNGKLTAKAQYGLD